MGVGEQAAIVKEAGETIEAEWRISLDTTCPRCRADVDLLDDPDFWDGNHFEAGEHRTDRTRGVEVACPNCGWEFKVNLIY
jgi:rubredoxin